MNEYEGDCRPCKGKELVRVYLESGHNYIQFANIVNWKNTDRLSKDISPIKGWELCGKTTNQESENAPAEQKVYSISHHMQTTMFISSVKMNAVITLADF